MESGLTMTVKEDAAATPIERLEIPDAAVRYILFQRTAYLAHRRKFPLKLLWKLLPFVSFERWVALEANLRGPAIKAMYARDMELDFRSIREFLPRECSSVLDVGCGVAGIDVFLARHYAGRPIPFYLLDKSSIDRKVHYRFTPKGSFCNSLEVAGQILALNGVDRARLHLLEATENNDIQIAGRVGLILSLISWGFHYPVGTYLDRAYDLLCEGGTLILDIRKGTDGLEAIGHKFGVYTVIANYDKHHRIAATKPALIPDEPQRPARR